LLVQTESQRFLVSLSEELYELPVRSQIAYGAACCERHFGDYLKFSEAQGWGDPRALREALDTSWKISLGEISFATVGTVTLQSRCMKAIPPSEDFSSPDADYAQNLAIMVTHLVEFIGKQDTSLIVMIATLARDLIDAKVQITGGLDASDPYLERKIANSGLMVSEMNFLRSCLIMLKQVRNDGEFAELRKFAGGV
jgi:uncharacterized protein YjaG (DUF416 family)